MADAIPPPFQNQIRLVDLPVTWPMLRQFAVMLLRGRQPRLEVHMAFRGDIQIDTLAARFGVAP